MKPRVQLGSWLTIAGFTGEVTSIAKSGVQLRGEGGEVREFSLAQVEESL
jgi:hypothetical protein|tara:strand:+ start:518 stop:667 length:150 start_codon:yes stop_codon:yes gene_type:complete